MTKTFSAEDIQAISFFEKATGTAVKDCIIDEESAYFLVDKIGLALGKNGSKIRAIQMSIKKRVKVIEYAENVSEQIKKMIPESQNIKGEKSSFVVNVPREHKAKIIGKNGANINKIRQLLERNHNVEKLVVV